MASLTRDSVVKRIAAMKKDSFLFGELRKGMAADYDSLKEIVFSLLDEKDSMLMQVFDKDAGEVRLQRRRNK